MELIVVAVIVLALFVRQTRRRTAAAAATPDLGPVGWAGGARWRVVLPLGRVENGRLLRHPAFLAGLAITPLMLLAATDSEDVWWRISPGIALALVPLGWFTIVAVNLLATRPRRAATEELWASLPASAPVRTAGLLTAVLVASVAAALFAVAMTVFIVQTRPEVTGAVNWAEVAAGVVIVAGSVTVGVAVARWLPHPGFGLVAAIATAFIQGRFFTITSWPWNRSQANPFRFLAFIAQPTSTDPSLELRPAGWHLVYLVALVLVMAAVALARNGIPRVLAGGLAFAALLAAVGGWAETRPPTEGQVAAMVSYLTEPARHQTCESSGSTRYCAYPPARRDISHWRKPVEAVRALLPAAVSQRPAKVTGRVPTVAGNNNCGAQPYTEGLPPEVANRISAGAVWPDDGAIHPGIDNFSCGGRAAHGLFLAVQTGAWAVGLPAAPHHLDVRCRADGQARTVVALWLGAAATPDGAHILRELVADAGKGRELDFSDWDEPPMWGVHFSRADARTAISLLGRPTADVTRVIADRWPVLIDPRTPSSEVAGPLGVTTSGDLAAGSADACP